MINRETTRRAALATLGLGFALASGRAASAPPPVRVGWVPSIGASALFVLDGEGWAKQAGLGLSLIRFESGPAAIQALASGTLDLLAIGVAPVAIAYAKKIPVRIVCAAGLGGSSFMARAPLAAALESAADPAAAFAAMRAKLGRPVRLAALPPGGVPTVALEHWLFKIHSVSHDDVRIAPLGIDGVQQALLAGAVDGGAVLEPWATLIRIRDPGIEAIASAPQMFPGIPGVAIAATQRFADSRPDALQDFVGLMIRATALLQENPAAAAPMVARGLTGGLAPASAVLIALKSRDIGFVTDPQSIIPATRAMLAYEAELGDFPAAPDVAGLFDRSWWTRAQTH
jgi:NitT/TauT family transport system substrate-binding protein